MLIAAKDMSEVDKLKALLKQEFEMKDLRAAKKILGMEIHRNRQEGKLFLSQKKYIEKVLERFGMLDAKPVILHLLLIFDFQQICLLKLMKKRCTCLMFPMPVQLEAFCML